MTTKTFTLTLTGPDTVTEYRLTIDELGQVTEALANMAATAKGERHTRTLDLKMRLDPSALKAVTDNVREQMAALSHEGGLMWLLSTEGGRDSDSKSVQLTGN